MGWAVVTFTEENTVEVVPTSWYIKTSKECFWPPKGTKKSCFLKLVQFGREPDEDWDVHSANLLGEYNDFEVAKKKAQRAEVTSELSSISSCENDGRRKVKPNPKYNTTNTSSDDNVTDEDEQRYPTFSMKRAYKSVASTPNPKSYSHSQMNERATVSTLNSSQNKAQIQDNEKVDGNINITRNSQNENGIKRMMEEIALLNIKMDQVLDILREQRHMDHLENTKIKPNSEEFYVRIPIKDDADLTELESWLQNAINYKVAVMELSRIGGGSMGQSVRKILYRVVSNEVANGFSWDGIKKRSFKNLNLSKVIIDSIKYAYKNCTEDEIIKVIKMWLVKAKERIERKEKKLAQDAE